MAEREIEVVREVFARVRNKDPRVADLYCVDATLTENGIVHAGRDAIREFYLRVFSASAPHPMVRGTWQGGSTYVALVEVTLGSGEVAHAADVFDVGDEGIRSLRICLGGLDRGWVPLSATGGADAPDL
jgi:hypothetical protein